MKASRRERKAARERKWRHAVVEASKFYDVKVPRRLVAKRRKLLDKR